MLSTTFPWPYRIRLQRLTRAALPALAALCLAAFVVHAAIADLDDQPPISVAPLTMTSYDLSNGGAVAFRGDFFGGNWDGDLVAYDISGAGTSAVKWQARDQLALVDWNAGRKIFTMNGATGVSFAWTASTPALSAAQQAALGGDPIGRQLLEYTRGNSALEGSSFRPRLSRLGDIVHSRPYYLRHSATEERVYVGANDGMLHAFDAGTGAEVFAYIPSMLLPKLSQFAVNPYVNHQYGVDGQLAHVRINSGGTPQTLLAGGLGGGARGLYSLDISNPSPASESAAATMAKWEITEASGGYANLGHVYGAPVYAQLNSGQSVLLVANGVNSSAGKASLYIINPQTGALLAEVMADASGPDNGLTAISAADLNGDGRIDVVYGGDLKGNLWKFNFAGSAWPAAATALFTPPASEARPILSAPALSLAPMGGVMVNFGTGKLLEPADISSTANDYLYGVLDSPRATASSLAQATLSTVTSSGSTPVPYRLATSSAPNYAGGARGWRITLPGGERLIGGDSLVNAGRFVVTTAVPDPTASGYGGWLLQIDALTGGGPATPFIDINSDGVIDLNGNSDRVQVISAGTTNWQSPVGKFLGRGIWSQPVLARVSQSFDLPLFNFNNNDVLTSVLTASTTVADPGVAGGHFDFDLYYNVCDPNAQDYSNSCTKHPDIHVHQYDDKYNVVGVNLLNASEPKLNLSAAVPSTTTAFKILVANANLSPAASLTLGSTTRPVWNLPVSPEGFIASTSGGPATLFTQSSIGKLILSLPTNAFSNQAWVPGSTDVRAGLLPSDTACVHKNLGAAGAGAGPWMNGALTLQIVSALTDGSMVELNQPDLPAAGYRLKKTSSRQSNPQSMQLAQYTLFWHHPNHICVGQPGWSATPPADTSTATYTAPAPGSADPRGDFGSGGGSLIGGGTGVQTITVYSGRQAYAVLTYDAAQDRYTRTIRATSDGSVLRTDSYAHNPATELVRSNLQTGRPMMLGRLSWREVLR